MALDLLGEGFDLHGGGNDLAFPHHENERAQALGAGHPFARHWVHSGMVTAAGGEEMHKSLGNFVNLTDLLDRVDGRAYRMLVLQSHYRSPLQVTDDTIERAVSTLERLDAFGRRFAAARGGTVNTPDIDRFIERMDDDLDTPAVMAAVFDLVREANAAADSGDEPTANRAAASVFVIAEALGLAIKEMTDDVDDATAALINERDAARREKNWAEADRIRDELVALGWTVEDGPRGTTVHR
jgi:cysteinyl-tRNA synthetase